MGTSSGTLAADCASITSIGSRRPTAGVYSAWLPLGAAFRAARPAAARSPAVARLSVPGAASGRACPVPERAIVTISSASVGLTRPEVGPAPPTANDPPVHSVHHHADAEDADENTHGDGGGPARAPAI